MWSPALLALLALAVAPLARAVALVGTTGRTGQLNLRSLRPQADESLVRPLDFEQQLLLCNAYPSDAPVVVTKNGKETLADETSPLHFRDCRYLPGRLRAHDKLDMSLRGQEVHGSFEVGDLPASDAVLLLVLGRHASSPLLSFKSFAFPVGADSKDAQLAVIDSFGGNSSAPHLRMEDHMTGKEEQTVSKRVEQLSFNRVYAVEEGTYDASVADRHRTGDAAAELSLENSTKKVLKLAGQRLYVLLRTGDGGHFPEALALFPEGPRSGARRGLLGLSVALLAVLAVGAA